MTSLNGMHSCKLASTCPAWVQVELCTQIVMHTWTKGNQCTYNGDVCAIDQVIGFDYNFHDLNDLCSATVNIPRH